MSDLIRRQDAIDVFEILADKMSDAGQTVMAQAVAVCKDLRSAGPEWVLESAIDYLHSVGWLQEHDRILTESAEPERKKGKWIYDMQCIRGDGRIIRQFHCSECGTQGIDALFNFCPYCGADMRGGNE